jgi:hypothetical protein
MHKHLAIALAVLSMSFATQAQQTATGESQAAAIAQTAPINITMPASDPNQTVTYAGKQRIDTTGVAYMPGMAVSSGGFNCAATGGVAVGVPGGALAVGGAKSLDDCVKMNLMNFAILAKDPELYEGIICTMPAAKEAYAEIGRKCPSEKRAGVQAKPMPKPWEAGG